MTTQLQPTQGRAHLKAPLLGISKYSGVRLFIHPATEHNKHPRTGFDIYQKFSYSKTPVSKRTRIGHLQTFEKDISFKTDAYIRKFRSTPIFNKFAAITKNTVVCWPLSCKKPNAKISTCRTFYHTQWNYEQTSLYLLCIQQTSSKYFILESCILRNFASPTLSKRDLNPLVPPTFVSDRFYPHLPLWFLLLPPNFNLNFALPPPRQRTY